MKAHKPDRADQWRRMHGLWVLERCGALDDATLTAATTDDSLGVRVHAQRVLSEREKWNAGERALALAGPEGLLRGRAAGGRRSARPAPLAGQHTAAAGPALRCRRPRTRTCCTSSAWPCATSCSPAAAWDALPKDLTERDAHAIADVAPGVHTPEAAAFLLKHIGKIRKSRDVVVNAVHHIARYGAPETTKSLLTFARTHHPEDIGLQADLLKAIRNGIGGARRIARRRRPRLGRRAGRQTAGVEAAGGREGRRRAGGAGQAGERGGQSDGPGGRPFGAAGESRGGPRSADGPRRRSKNAAGGGRRPGRGGRPDRAARGGGEAAGPGQQARNAGAAAAGVAGGPGPTADGHRRRAGRQPGGRREAAGGGRGRQGVGPAAPGKGGRDAADGQQDSGY